MLAAGLLPVSAHFQQNDTVALSHILLKLAASTFTTAKALHMFEEKSQGIIGASASMRRFEVRSRFAVKPVLHDGGLKGHSSNKMALFVCRTFCQTWLLRKVRRRQSYTSFRRRKGWLFCLGLFF
jgi:hypothetical protein